MAFEAGYNKYAQWKYAGAGGFVTLNVTGHSWEESVDKLDVTHTGTGGLQALLAGIFRGQGTVKANYDSAAMPHGAPRIGAGVRGALALYLGGATPFLIPAMILKVNYQTAVEGKVEYSFNVEIDYNALSSTAYTYPT